MKQAEIESAEKAVVTSRKRMKESEKMTVESDRKLEEKKRLQMLMKTFEASEEMSSNDMERVLAVCRAEVLRIQLFNE